MGHPELAGGTLQRPTRVRRSGTAPHQHGPEVAEGLASDPDRTLVELSLAVQAGCRPCVEHHAAAAGTQGVPRQQLLEALATALLLSTPHADRWPGLAEAALTVHEAARS